MDVSWAKWLVAEIFYVGFGIFLLSHGHNAETVPATAPSLQPVYLWSPISFSVTQVCSFPRGCYPHNTNLPAYQKWSCCAMSELISLDSFIFAEHFICKSYYFIFLSHQRRVFYSHPKESKWHLFCCVDLDLYCLGGEVMQYYLTIMLGFISWLYALFILRLCFQSFNYLVYVFSGCLNFFVGGL